MNVHPQLPKVARYAKASVPASVKAIRSLAPLCLLSALMVNKDECVLVFLLLGRAEEGTGECWRSTIATYTAPAYLDLLASYTLHSTKSQSICYNIVAVHTRVFQR